MDFFSHFDFFFLMMSKWMLRPLITICLGEILNLYEPSWQPFANTCLKSLLCCETLKDSSGVKRLDLEAKDICLYMYENKSCTSGWNRPPAFKLLTELVCNLSLLKWRWSFQLPCCDRVGGQTLPASPANPLLYFFFHLTVRKTKTPLQANMSN